MKEFDTHFEFTIWIHVHGRDEEGAIDNTRDYFNEDFVNGISEQMGCGMDYEPEVVAEMKNGLFEVALVWSGYWTWGYPDKEHPLHVKDKEEARKKAEELLDAKLSGRTGDAAIFQTIENFADKNSYLNFNGNMTDKVTDVVEW